MSWSGSIYTTTAISFERYITVCYPFFKISHNWSPRRYIVPILIFSASYNLPKFFELSVHEGNTIDNDIHDLLIILTAMEGVHFLIPTEMRSVFKSNQGLFIRYEGGGFCIHSFFFET